MIDRIGLALCLILLFVWSLPGTIALRALLLLVAFVLLARRLVGANLWHPGATTRLPLLLLAILTLWFVIQATLVSAETSWALGELRGQWFPALFALALGLSLGLAQIHMAGMAAIDAAPRPTLLPTAIVLVLSAQAAIAVGHSLWHWIVYGSLLYKLVPLTGGKLEMSFVLNLLLAFLVVDLYCRTTQRPPLLRLRLPLVLIICAIALASSSMAGARSGFIGLLFLSLSAIYIYIFDQRRRLGLARSLIYAVAIFAALSAFMLANYRADSRWQTFIETASIAWDIDQNRAWLARPGDTWPHLQDGRVVDPSAYARIAWLHAGLRVVADKPLGVGYGRNAFGHALRLTVDARVGHAHIGWIDLGIGGGWPALALWAAFLGSMAWLGWRHFFNDGQAAGLLLFFITMGYAGRMLLDSVNKDHMLQMFFFLAGLLLVLSQPQRYEAKE